MIKLQPAERARLSKGISKQLRDQIYDGVLKPGDRLPSLDVLSEAFGVGKPVVREAIQSLENSGMIFVKPGAGGGAFVRKVGTRFLSEVFEGIIKLDGVSFDELIEARLAVELGMLPKIIDHIESKDLKALEKNIEQAKECLEKKIKDSTNIEFHIILAKVINNKLLFKIVEAFSELGRKFIEENEYNYERNKKIIEEHEILLELLKAKRSDELMEMFGKHIEASWSFLNRTEDH